jgi:Collagen triple helix repeat (20 copies)
MSTIEKRFKVGVGIQFPDGTTVDTADGFIGATGAQGYQGDVGATGATGVQGLQGATGAAGSNGNQGATGAKGDTGNQGATGAAGSNGNDGATGAKGDTGNQGATGAAGSNGNDGATGATGSNGNDGATGATGIQGNDGATGATGLGYGNASSTSTVSASTGSKTFIIDYPSGSNAYGVGNTIKIVASGQSGSMIGSITSYSGYTVVVNVTYNSIASGSYSSWTLALSGIPGATGLQGATGIQGPQGATGFTGSTGAQGNQGSTGVTGNDGATGAKGDTGNQGATGAQGNVGATGAQGTTGNDGATGATGQTGATGAQGVSNSIFLYQADTANHSTGTYPGNGNVDWDNATQVSATHIMLSHLTNDNLDIDIYLALLQSSQEFVIQDANNSANYQTWRITGTPTNTVSGANSWWVIPVALVNSGGTGTSNFPNNHALFVGLIAGAQGATGAQGYTGATGATGNNGATGAQGYTGATGAQGNDGATGASGTFPSPMNSTTNTNFDVVLTSGGLPYTSDYGIYGNPLTGAVQAGRFLAAEIISPGVNGGYSFTDDGGQDTGMFSSGDGNLSFYNNNVQTANVTQYGWTFEQDVTTQGHFVATSATEATTTISLDAGEYIQYSYYKNGIDNSAAVNLTSFSLDQTAIKFFIQAVDTASGGAKRVHALELICIYANGDIYETEYGITLSDTELGTFQNAIVSGNIVLQYVPDSSVTSVNIRVMATALYS